MKKILGVSVAAMLAVTPMMANATKTSNSVDTVANVTTDVNMATTSYVQGAYNVLAGAHNAVITDITVPAKANNETYNHIAAADSVQENLVALDTAVGTIPTLANDAEYGSGISNSNSVAANLVALDTAISAINGVAGNYELATDSAVIASDLDSTSGVTNHIAVDTPVHTNLSTLNAAVIANDTAIANNADAIGNSGGSTISFAGTNYLTQEDNLVDAVKVLDTQVDANADKIGTIPMTDANSQAITYSSGISESNTVAQNLVSLNNAIVTNNGAAANNTAAIGADGNSTMGFSGTHYLNNSQTVKAAATTLDSQIYTVDNTTIPVVTTWNTGTDTVTQRAISSFRS